MRPAALLLTPILVLVAACATSPSAPPSTAPVSPTPIAVGEPSPSSVPSIPVATPSPVPPPTTGPSAPAESPEGTPAPSEDPSAAMTPQERALIRMLRVDAGVDCAPRRADLPEGALRGIECRPNDPLVARVGIYEFKDPIQAAYAYMTRMAASGVDVNAGDCMHDVPGESAWTPGDGEGNYDDPGVFNWENSALSPSRSGCFRDENGDANVRVTCGNAYIGVLGTGTDLSALNDWTWTYPAGYEPGTPDSPGICVGPAANG